MKLVFIFSIFPFFFPLPCLFCFISSFIPFSLSFSLFPFLLSFFLLWIEYSCWLTREALFKGMLYLTTKHICFHSHVPTEEVGACWKHKTNTNKQINTITKYNYKIHKTNYKIQNTQNTKTHKTQIQREQKQKLFSFHLFQA